MIAVSVWAFCSSSHDLKCQNQDLFVTISSLSFVSGTVTPAATLTGRLVPLLKKKSLF